MLPFLRDARAADLEGSSLDALTASLTRQAAPGSLFVANSLGAQVAVEAAVRTRGLARGLVLTGPTWDPAAPTVPRQFARLVLDSYREAPSLVPVALADYVRRGPLEILGTARSMLRHPMADRLAALRAPATIVRGERDPICTAAWAEYAAAAAGATLRVVAGAAHAVDWSHPAAVVEAIEELEQRIRER